MTQSMAIKKKLIEEDTSKSSPVDKFSSYGFQDLAQEFSMLEKKRPRNIVLEEASNG